MAGVSIVADFTGLGSVQAALRELAHRTDDLTPLMDEIGSALADSTRHRFEAQKDPEGKPWRPLSEMTILGRLGGVSKAYTKKMNFTARAKRQIGNMKILQASRRLELSITHHVSRDAVEVGSNVIYAAIHQFGGEAGRGKKIRIPARPYLGIDAADESAIAGAINRYLASLTP